MSEVTKPKRPWWRKKRWMMLGSLWLAMAYLASEGPGRYAVGKDWLSYSRCSWLYRPVDAVVRDWPRLSHLRNRHRNWWADLAGEEPSGARIGTSGVNWSVSLLVHPGMDLRMSNRRDPEIEIAVGNRLVAIENGTRLDDGGYAWDGPITLDGRTIATLPKESRIISITVNDGKYSVVADGIRCDTD